MKQCPKCGQFFDDSATFCSACGAALDGGSADDSGRPYPPTPLYSDPGQSGPAQRVATKQEFLKLPENAKTKKEIMTTAIVSYICAGLTAAVMIGANGNFTAIVDVLLLIGLGLGIQLKQSRVCAILLCVDGAVSVIVSLLAAGTPSGYLILIAGIFAIVYTFKLDKAWKQYQAGA